MPLLNDIHFNNLKGDLFGGVTAAVIALPMALSFGVASGAGPAAGLYGAVLVGLLDRIGEKNIFNTLDQAQARATELLNENDALKAS
jgi:hypothetical protein